MRNPEYIPVPNVLFKSAGLKLSKKKTCRMATVTIRFASEPTAGFSRTILYPPSPKTWFGIWIPNKPLQLPDISAKQFDSCRIEAQTIRSTSELAVWTCNICNISSNQFSKSLFVYVWKIFVKTNWNFALLMYVQCVLAFFHSNFIFKKPQAKIFIF
jgi:hypothetical protein